MECLIRKIKKKTSYFSRGKEQLGALLITSEREIRENRYFFFMRLHDIFISRVVALERKRIFLHQCLVNNTMLPFENRGGPFADIINSQLTAF